jgi:hypothetical protein
MKKSTLLLLLTIFNFCLAFGQFKPNSIGICYLRQDTADYYSLTISLPFQTLTDQSSTQIIEYPKVIDSINYSGQITLFDKAGEITRIDSNNKFLLEFWCENDGGIQYRPTLKTKIKKANCKRPLNAIIEIQNICCFAILDRIKQKTEVTDLTNTADIKLMGDYDSDGNIDCLIWTDIDEALNCDREPPNNLSIMLQVGKQNFRMRCCGP